MPLVDLHKDRNNPGLYVCDEDNDEFDPWRLPAKSPDRIAAPFTRPDDPLNAGNAAAVATVDFPVLAALTLVGKVYSAWVLPSSNPTQYLTLNGSKVSAWAAGYGSELVDLAQVASAKQPIWDPILYDGQGGVTFDGTSQYLEGVNAPIAWPTADVVLLAALRTTDIVPGGDRTAFGYGDTDVLRRALSKGGNRQNAALLATSPSLSADIQSAGISLGARLASGGGMSTLSVNGAVQASAMTAQTGVTLSRVRAGTNTTLVPTSFWQGDIEAMAVLSSTLTSSEWLALQAEFLATVS